MCIRDSNIPEPGIPESFKVLLKELQSLALDIRVLRADSTEVEIKESVDDDDDFNDNMEMQVVNDIDKDSNGYTEEDGGLNDAIDMIFGKDGEEDFEFDDFEDNDNGYDDEEMCIRDSSLHNGKGTS